MREITFTAWNFAENDICVAYSVSFKPVDCTCAVEDRWEMEVQYGNSVQLPLQM